MMATYRIVSTNFWEDEKIIDLFSPEDKYFMLYLLTNPRTTQLGIYKLPKKIMSFELGYSNESVSVLIDRFETKYNTISYNHKTQEIAILNSLKYSIVKGGKPTQDLLIKELSKVDDVDLIIKVYNKTIEWWEASNRSFDKTIKEMFEEEFIKRKVPKEKLLIYNSNIYNDNDNEDSYHESCNESLAIPLPNKKEIYEKIRNAFNEIDGLAKIKVVTNTRKKKIDARLKEFNEEIILQAIAKIKTSNFLKGENKSGWKITFDWLMANDTNLMKVLEGNFDNRKQKGGLDAFKEIYKKFDEEERENEK